MADSSFILASPSALLEIQPLTINWKLCFICGKEEIKSVQLIKPYARRGFRADKPETHGSYTSVASKLELIRNSNALPENLNKRLKIIFDADDEFESREVALQNTFVQNSAIFHKKCLTTLDNKLREKRKRTEANEYKTVNPTPAKRTRRSFTAQNFTKQCFFCDKDDGSYHLHKCSTKLLTKHVEKWAKYLMKDALIAKLSEGDMCATEAMYHKECLTSIYNKYRDKVTSDKDSIDLFRDIETKALDNVVEFVKNTIISCSEIKSTPVFPQKLLTEMYKEKIIHHGKLYDSIDATGCYLLVSM